MTTDRSLPVARWTSIAFVSSLLLAGAAASQPVTKAADPHFDFAPGFLAQSALPDSLNLLPPPPSPNTAAWARDEEARASTLPLRKTARWKLARLDADLMFPQPAKNFSCAMGIPIDEKNTPNVYQLMQKLLTDAGLSTYGAKNHYNRTRPFVVHSEATCTPDQEGILRGDGSYPSGHTAAGWAWALSLVEINPSRTDQLLQRAREFGQSRVICNAHWQSDVDNGKEMGAATFARLHADAEFRNKIAAAKAEVENAQRAGLKPEGDCSAEAAAISPK